MNNRAQQVAANADYGLAHFYEQGDLIDQSPEPAGLQHLFMLLLVFSIVGAIAAIAFERQARAASVTGAINSP